MVALVKESQQAHAPDSSVVLDQEDVSPFLQADVVPKDVMTRPQHPHQAQHHHKQQHQQQQHKPSKKKGSAFARLLCCTAAAKSDVFEPVDELPVQEYAGSITPVTSQHSWARVIAVHAGDKQLHTLHSRASSEYYDAHSTVSDLTPQHSQEPPSPAGVDQNTPRAAATHIPQEQPYWAPQTPLLFAPPGLKFVPVPAVTGYAGVWEMIRERSSPHPQPIDIMVGANTIVRKIHESIPGITIEEDDHFIKMIAQPGFLPKGVPSAHTETYDKTHKTCPAWVPRRDVKLTGHARAEGVYFTDDGGLILRHEAWSFLAKKPDFIVEDYLTLEDNGTVIVDRMCCLNTKTGERAEQLQVVKLVKGANGQPV